MDYDATFNLTTNENNELPASASRNYLTREIVLGIFFVIGICADVLITYTIFRFKRMRSVPNILVANWAIADLVSLFVTPSGYRLISVIANIGLPHGLLCFIEEAATVLHITVIIFVLVTLFDWTLAAYFEATSRKIRSNHKVVVGAVWLFSIVCTSVSTGLCMNKKYYFIHHFILFVLSYGVILLFVIICQTCRGIQKCRGRLTDTDSLNLNLATAYIVISVLSIINILFITNVVQHQIMEIIGSIGIFSSSVVNLILLYILDRDFHCCLLQVLKRSDNKYEDSICDFNNPLINNDNASVKISFENENSDLN